MTDAVRKEDRLDEVRHILRQLIGWGAVIGALWAGYAMYNLSHHGEVSPPKTVIIYVP